MTGPLMLAGRRSQPPIASKNNKGGFDMKIKQVQKARFRQMIKAHAMQVNAIFHGSTAKIAPKTHELMMAVRWFM